MPHLLIKLSFKKRMTKTVFHIVVNLKKVYLNRKKESTEKIALRTIWKVHLCINSGATGIRFSVIQTHRQSEIFKLYIPGRFNNNLTEYPLIKIDWLTHRNVNQETHIKTISGTGSFLYYLSLLVHVYQNINNIYNVHSTVNLVLKYRMCNKYLPE